MRKHNYIVGFEGERGCAYGKGSFVQPMTILQAIRELKTLSGTEKAIYKLVKVDPKKEKFKQKIRSQMVSK